MLIIALAQRGLINRKAAIFKLPMVKANHRNPLAMILIRVCQDVSKLDYARRLMITLGGCGGLFEIFGLVNLQLFRELEQNVMNCLSAGRSWRRVKISLSFVCVYANMEAARIIVWGLLGLADKLEDFRGEQSVDQLRLFRFCHLSAIFVGELDGSHGGRDGTEDVLSIAIANEVIGSEINLSDTLSMI